MVACVSVDLDSPRAISDCVPITYLSTDANPRLKNRSIQTSMKRKDAITKASRYSRVTSCRTGEILPTPSTLTISSDAAFLSGQTANEA